MSEYATWLGAEYQRCQKIKDPKKREKCIEDLLELAKIEQELEEEAWGLGYPY